MLASMDEDLITAGPQSAREWTGFDELRAGPDNGHNSMVSHANASLLHYTNTSHDNDQSHTATKDEKVLGLSR